MGQTNQTYVYATLIYYLVYFPLLAHFERTRQWHPLHASAVTWSQGAVTLAGLGGVGKSTLTLAFLGDPEARLLSENLVLHDGERVYAFPEPLHLDNRSQELLARLNVRLSPTGQPFSHDRRSYEVPAPARAASAVPRLLCFLRQGQKLDLRPLSVGEALECMSSSDLLAKELNAYAQQAAMLNLLSPSASSLGARIDALQTLLSQVACYDLTVEPGQDLDRVTRLVRGRLG